MSKRTTKNFKTTEVSIIKDQPTRDLLFRLVQYIERNPLLSCGFEFIEYTFTGAATDARIPHGFGFTPKDVFLTGKTGSASVTINYSRTDNTYLYISSTGATTIRLFVGSYRSE